MSLTITPGFRSRLTQALLGDPHAPLVLLGNFEVEEVWAQGEIGLPRIPGSSAAPITYRLDEHMLTMGGPEDVVILKAPPDPAYREYLERLGLRLPRVIVPAAQEPGRCVTRDVVEDPAVRAELSRLAGLGYRLFPHGVSRDEEDLATDCGIALAAPPAAVCKAVNSKVFSWQAATALGLRQPQGWACTTLGEFHQAMSEARDLVARGARVAVKDAFGVSGKGIVVADSTRRLDRLHRLVLGQCERAGRTDLALTVEEWVDKGCDLNYQFTIDRTGEMHFDFVKEALTHCGVHRGHRVPAQISADHRTLLEDSADGLATALFAAGYTGVVGVDALIDARGLLYPVIEVNARNNMSTYAVPLQEQVLAKDAVQLSRHYALTLSSPVSFDQLAHVLDGLLLTGPGARGLLVTDFATVNAALSTPTTGQAREGRLYGIVAADTESAVVDLAAAVANRLVLAGLADPRRS